MPRAMRFVAPHWQQRSKTGAEGLTADERNRKGPANLTRMKKANAVNIGLSHRKIWSGRSDSNTRPLAPHAGDCSDTSHCFIRVTTLFMSGKTSVFLCLCKRKNAARRGRFAHPFTEKLEGSGAPEWLAATSNSHHNRLRCNIHNLAKGKSNVLALSRDCSRHRMARNLVHRSSTSPRSDKYHLPSSVCPLGSGLCLAEPVGPRFAWWEVLCPPPCQGDPETHATY
jgi:hypothetical protein